VPDSASPSAESRRAYPEEVPSAAVSYLGSLVKVDPALFVKYSWTGRSIKYHRSQVREVYGT
jgi:hypothetical protein